MHDNNPKSSSLMTVKVKADTVADLKVQAQPNDNIETTSSRKTSKIAETTQSRDFRSDIIVDSNAVNTSAHQIPPPANWVSILALLLSFFALVKSHYTELKANRAKEAAKFEAEYGSAIRTGLREYQNAIYTLKSYALPPSRKRISDLKKELSLDVSKWMEASEKLIALLLEPDNAADTTGLAQSFEARYRLSEDDLTKICLASTTIEDIKSMATSIHSNLTIAVEEVRAGLVKHVKTYNKVISNKKRWLWFI